jgi:hypothetical protein
MIYEESENESGSEFSSVEPRNELEVFHQRVVRRG